MGVLYVMYEKENTFNIKKMIRNPYDKSPSKKRLSKRSKGNTILQDYNLTRVNHAGT